MKEHYLHLPTEKKITMIRHRRRGPSALRKEIKNLGIFFYRGDSNDGGSGTMWLTAWEKQVKNGTALPLLIFEKLVNGGLIVTDGSMCEKNGNPYSFFNSAAIEYKQTGKLEISCFKDILGNTFENIGSIIDRRSRRTLIWKIHKQD